MKDFPNEGCKQAYDCGIEYVKAGQGFENLGTALQFCESREEEAYFLFGCAAQAKVPVNVRQYFERAFPSVFDEFSEDDLKDMATMPLDSNCGEDCKTAVDRAKALDELIAQGHGPDFYPNHRAETMSIARVALDLCNLYICG